MIAHLWELRADPTLLETGARQWARVAADLSSTADDLVEATRHALDQGWESESAESYELYRRQLVEQIDTFTSIADRISGSLFALAGMLTTTQEELDRAWVPVAAVPHDLVGAERVLVLNPATPADEELVRSATVTAREIRSRLEDQLYAEAGRLREARMELGTVSTELVQVSGGVWPAGFDGASVHGAGAAGAGGAFAATGGASNVLDSVWIDGPGADLGSSSVAGSAAGGGAGAGGAAAAGVPSLPPVAAIAVSMPDLTGLSAGALASGAAGLLGGAAARRGAKRREEPAPGAGTGMAPMGGMAAGAAMRSGGTLGRTGGSGTGPGTGPGGGSGRSGAGRSPKPVLGQESEEEKAARVAREKEQVREAKRQLIAERQAERAARRAQRAGSAEPESKAASARASAKASDEASEEEDRPVIEVVVAAPGGQDTTPAEPDPAPVEPVERVKPVQAPAAEDPRPRR